MLKCLELILLLLLNAIKFNQIRKPTIVVGHVIDFLI